MWRLACEAGWHRARTFCILAGASLPAGPVLSLLEATHAPHAPFPVGSLASLMCKEASDPSRPQDSHCLDVLSLSVG